MSAPSLEKSLNAKQRTWKRRYERFRADFPIRVTVLQEGGYADIQGRCSDIGRGGIGAVLAAEVNPGEVVSVEFSLASLGSVRSIVRYRRGFLHGMEFLGLSLEQQSVIEQACQTLTRLG